MRTVCLTGAMVVWAAAATAQAPQLADVLSRAAQYVATLESTLATVAVDEEYQQNAETNKMLGGSSLGVQSGAAGAMLEGHTTREKRRSQSELLFIRRKDSPLVWSGLRNPLQIDGKPTGNDAGRLGRLAAEGQLDRQWTALADATRAVQIGEPVRGLHAPWTALALLRADQQPRVVFKKDGDETVAGVRTWKVAFTEQKGPSLLRSGGNIQLPSRGVFWIDPQTGQVLRSKLELGTGLSMEQMRIEVEYAPDAGLGVPVPVSMKEKHETERGKVDAKAAFTNYRRIGGA